MIKVINEKRFSSNLNHIMNHEDDEMAIIELIIKVKINIVWNGIFI
jgi:hypothetical protein